MPVHNQWSRLDPTVVVSFDVELLWGIAHTADDPAPLMQDPQRCRGSFRLLLDLLEKYGVPATWAFVGHLFLGGCERKSGVAHPDLPRFKEDWFACDPCSDIKRNPLWYGRDILEDVLASRIRHEIGYHSFSHVVFSDCSRQVAEGEVAAGVSLARGLGLDLKSFVFPHDGIGHLDVLKEYGFKVYRGRTAKRGRLGQPAPIRKLNSAVDKLLVRPVRPRCVGGIWELPSSMQFCDTGIYRHTLLFRAKTGIEMAIRRGLVFHVWLHPENLVRYAFLAEHLRTLLAFVAAKRDAGQVHVATMSGLLGGVRNREPV